MWKKSSFCSTDGCVEAGSWERASFCQDNGGSCVEIGAWNTSSLSYANGNCVEAGGFKKPGFSNSGNCVEAGGAVKSSFSAANGHSVEVVNVQHVIAVRDTKDRSIKPVVFSLSAWQAFIDDVKAGKYPLAVDVAEYYIGHLVFNRDEWDAFVRGAQNPDENGRGEFDLSPELEAELAHA